MNSREKGKRGERAWRDELRANGYDARRGQQFRGSPDSPDVICDALPRIHFEVKCVERLNIEDAMDQARHDAGVKAPVVAHKRNFRPWLVTTDAHTFFRAIRGDFANSVMSTSPRPSPQSGEGEKISAAACAAATNENNKPKEKNENPS